MIDLDVNISKITETYSELHSSHYQVKILKQVNRKYIS